MEISKENRLYRVFMWCLKVCERFTDNSYLIREYDYGNKTNLCHFVRVIMLYTPFILLFNLVVYVAAIFSIVLPFYLFGIVGVGKALIYILLTVGVCSGLIYLFFFFLATRVNETEVYRVTKGYCKAVKEKVCPYIYFKGEEDEIH